MSDKAVLTEKQIDAIGEIGNISMTPQLRQCTT
jgi:chemotaxis protein CheY-P-specific phosphatase CheC